MCGLDYFIRRGKIFLLKKERAVKITFTALISIVITNYGVPPVPMVVVIVVASTTVITVHP